ncbi:helix-turn-helix transcriptional regulator [Phenylobacterium sp.]|jgi:AraC-like DNA-binding protein|uniref:helix-turn-helix domain-containing protein n=1 Tax=Phenylobacterium sp. TaxID=1871053 RepID=UPI002F3E766B
MLSLFVIGSFSNRTEAGEKFIAGPSAIFYQAGAAHQNTVGPNGFEQIEIEFDPAWLGRSLLPRAPVAHWIGGVTGARARTIARLCASELAEDQFRSVLRQFVRGGASQPQPRSPEWVDAVAQRARAEGTATVTELARQVGRHPSWLGSAYGRAFGERLQETAARIRVERAARLLRETDEPLALIALDAGFCDQSHMNRTFRRFLGRSPILVREDRRTIRC